jgi:predicted transcriptional regulator
MVDVTLHLESEEASRLERLCRQTGQDPASAVMDALAIYEQSLDQESSQPPSPEDMASITRGVADIAAGRVTDHDVLFARLADKYGG